jgi:hypothetical protein
MQMNINKALAGKFTWAPGDNVAPLIGNIISPTAEHFTVICLFTTLQMLSNLHQHRINEMHPASFYFLTHRRVTTTVKKKQIWVHT